MSETIMKVIVGSQMWGTNTPESDTDYKEIVKAPLEDVLNPFKNLGKGIQRENEGDDNAIYELMHFMRLVEKGNPTMLEVLYTPHVVIASPISFEIRSYRHEFLDSQKIISATLGMSKAQVKRAERYAKDDQNDRRIGKLYASTILSLELTIDVVESRGFMSDIEPTPLREFLIDLKKGDTSLYNDAVNFIEFNEALLKLKEQDADCQFVANKLLMADLCADWYQRR